MRFLIESSGSLISGYLIKVIKESGNEVIASDIDDFNHAKYLADDFIIFPKSDHPELWNIIENELLLNKIDIVIPSFDITLSQWASKKEYFESLGIKIIISPFETIKIFCDKWETYNFFRSINIRTPRSSLKQEFGLVKPRTGSGGSDIYIGTQKKSMQGKISQEFIEGIEYTIDCLFNKEGKPIYIIPRKRLDIKDGKSTKGIVVEHKIIQDNIKKIAQNIKFIGPINFQCIGTKNKDIYFIEINPRIAGGMALGMAASENWISIILDNIIGNKDITPKKINYGLKMVRYYDECFI